MNDVMSKRITLWHLIVVVHRALTQNLMVETGCKCFILFCLVIPSAQVFLQALEGLNQQQLALVSSHWDRLSCFWSGHAGTCHGWKFQDDCAPFSGPKARKWFQYACTTLIYDSAYLREGSYLCQLDTLYADYKIVWTNVLCLKA